MKMTVYVSDDLAAEVKAELGEANISGICQAALRAELERTRARAKLDKDGCSRIELWDSGRGRKVAFTGRRVTGDMYVDVYVTPKGGVVVDVPQAINGNLATYADFEAFAEDYGERGQDFMAAVADALGEEYTEELDV